MRRLLVLVFIAMVPAGWAGTITTATTSGDWFATPDAGSVGVVWSNGGPNDSLTNFYDAFISSGLVVNVPTGNGAKLYQGPKIEQLTNAGTLNVQPPDSNCGTLAVYNCQGRLTVGTQSTASGTLQPSITNTGTINISKGANGYGTLVLTAAYSNFQGSVIDNSGTINVGNGTWEAESSSSWATCPVTSV